MNKILLVALILGSVGCASTMRNGYSKIDYYECEKESAPIYQGKNNNVRLGAIYDCLEIREMTGKLKAPRE